MPSERRSPTESDACEVKRGIEMAVESVVEELHKMSKQVRDDNDVINNVAAIFA